MNISGFELNKIVAAILIALLLGVVAKKVSSILISPEKLTKPAYEVSVPKTHETGQKEEPKGPEPIEPLLAGADIEKGKKIANQCLMCHTLAKDGANKIGPNLYGIVGNKIRHKANYVYSKAFEKIEGHWTFEKISQFLTSPRKDIPGTKMTFAGISKAQDRADVIAYLNTLSDKPLPIPKEGEKEATQDQQKENNSPKG